MTDMAPERDDLIARINGRAAFCRDRGEVKTPMLLTQAATALEAAQARIDELEAMLTEDVTAPYLAGLARGRAEVQEEAAAKAEREGVYPELNVWNGGPDWYKHGKRIAAAIRALKGGSNG